MTVSPNCWRNSIRHAQYTLDRLVCLGRDYEAAHPEIFGTAFSPQGEGGQSWGKWWMWKAFVRLVEDPR